MSHRDAKAAWALHSCTAGSAAASPSHAFRSALALGWCLGHAFGFFLRCVSSVKHQHWKSCRILSLRVATTLTWFLRICWNLWWLSVGFQIVNAWEFRGDKGFTQTLRSSACRRAAERPASFHPKVSIGECLQEVLGHSHRLVRQDPTTQGPKPCEITQLTHLQTKPGGVQLQVHQIC